MGVIVDTPIWSLAFRRVRSAPADGRVLAEFGRLASTSMVELFGPVRQEALSGIRDSARFLQVRDALGTFPDVPIRAEDWEQAGECFNACRAGGVQASHVDMLLCSVGIRRDWPIFTLDRDFERYAEMLPITLHEPPARP